MEKANLWIIMLLPQQFLLLLNMVALVILKKMPFKNSEKKTSRFIIPFSLLLIGLIQIIDMMTEVNAN